ncbi:kinase-like domain-containing protein [Trichoderma pleuroticola]
MNRILASFRDRLEKCRHNIAGSDSFFYIYEELQHLVTPSLITDIISSSFQHQQLEDIVAIVTSDGIRLLCILALLDQIDQLTNFLAHSTLDSRLPIREEAELQAIAPDLKPVFFTKYQWQFFPWVFQKNYGHLVLHSRTVLPFISDEIIAEGSGGVVSAVEIPTQLQAFINSNDDKVRVVRKRIKALKSRERTEGLLREEVNCLELYRRLRHANIIPLLGSFTLNQEHNLIFPCYSKNLDEFLSQERVGQFMKNTTFSSALVGLASALQCVHETNWRCRVKPNFYTKYGYHHDFRPANILVTESTFVLADFGLAKFSSAPLATEWNENIGHYIAPECMDGSFNPLQVGYSYDIWAFGCFLAEIATYIALGPVGVQNFEIQRKSDTYYEKKYRNSYFFDGQLSSLKPQVRDWLLHLSNQTQDRTIVYLVSLARKMLQFSPKDRLDMNIHLVRLYFIHAKCLFYSSTNSLAQTLSQVNEMQYPGSDRASGELNLELSRLRAFGDFLHMSDATEVDCLHFRDAAFRNLVIDCLSRISTTHSFSKADLIKFTHECVSTERKSGVVTAFAPPKLIEESVQDDISKLCRALPD